MEIKIIATGSTGNSYILTEPKTGKFLVLDCGVRFETITHDKAFTGFKNCDAVIVTHSHGDHSLSLGKFEKSGVEALTYKTLSKAIGSTRIGDWKIVSFPVRHNVDNWGFIIENNNEPNEKYCYVTDFYGMPRIEGITRWLIEVNYVEEIIEQMIDEDKLDLNRTGFKYHNSLENTIDYFANQIQTKPKTIIACHISKNNGIKEIIQKELTPFAKEVIIAEGGLEWKKEAD